MYRVWGHYPNNERSSGKSHGTCHGSYYIVVSSLHMVADSMSFSISCLTIGWLYRDCLVGRILLCQAHEVSNAQDPEPQNQTP